MSQCAPRAKSAGNCTHAAGKEGLRLEAEESLHTAVAALSSCKEHRQLHASSR